MNSINVMNSSFFNVQEDLSDCIKPRDPVNGICRDVFKYLAGANSRGNR